jgi:hypothetical protein
MVGLQELVLPCCSRCAFYPIQWPDPASYINLERQSKFRARAMDFRPQLSQAAILLALGALLAGCMVMGKPAAVEIPSLDQPPAAVRTKVERFYPLVRAWYDAVEARYLPLGRPLTARELDDARWLGVLRPQELRVVVLDAFPMPEDVELREEAERHGLGSRTEAGRTMGHAILLKAWAVDEPTMLRHELVHVAQMDRLGREGFLRRYLLELEILGYARSPLELEAYARQGAPR